MRSACFAEGERLGKSGAKAGRAHGRRSLHSVGIYACPAISGRRNAVERPRSLLSGGGTEWSGWKVGGSGTKFAAGEPCRDWRGARRGSVRPGNPVFSGAGRVSARFFRRPRAIKAWNCPDWWPTRLPFERDGVGPRARGKRKGRRQPASACRGRRPGARPSGRSMSDGGARDRHSRGGTRRPYALRGY